VVEDQDQAIEDALAVLLDQRVRDLLRVLVDRTIGEARPDLAQRGAAEAERARALNAPARPRSPDISKMPVFAISRRSSSGWPLRAPVRLAVSEISSCMPLANGRSASMRTCARRSFAPATSSIALVILLVFLTEWIRRRMS
jgi:hypothetical protein